MMKSRRMKGMSLMQMSHWIVMEQVLTYPLDNQRERMMMVRIMRIGMMKMTNGHQNKLGELLMQR